MKTILCYGDSITWGYDPRDGSRYPFEQRWPGVQQAELGDRARIIEEALNGRTVATESWLLPNRSGRAMLEPLLESHAPLDIVIIMLGSNDQAVSLKLTPSQIAFGCATLAWLVQKSMAGPGGGTPEIVLVCPPRLGRLNAHMGLLFSGAEAVSKGLSAAYKTIAEAEGLHFLDASRIVKASPVDGLHLDPPENRKLALALKKVVEPLLAG